MVFIKVYSVRLDVYTVFIEAPHAPVYYSNPIFVNGILKFTDFIAAASGTSSTMDHVAVPVVERFLFVASAHYASIKEGSMIIMVR